MSRPGLVGRRLLAWALAGRAAANARPPAARGATSAPPATAVGFVGLGAMGGSMAARLHGAGFRLVACDPSAAARSALEARVKQGTGRLAFAPTPAAIAATPGLAAVFTSLPSLDALFEVWQGADGLLSASPSLTPPLLADLSTSGPAAARALAAAAERATLAPGVVPLSGSAGRHPLTLDAPVSGGVGAAAAGTLTFLVGGPGAALEAARPFLAAMGGRTLHVSPLPGSGQAAKVANNAALAVQMAGLCEALASVSACSGVDPGRLLAAVRASSGRCWASDAYPPVPGCTAVDGSPVPATDGAYAGGFAVRLMLKDLGLAAGARAGGAGTGGPDAPPFLPMAAAAAGVYERLLQAAGPDIDFSAVYRFVYGGGAAGDGESGP